MKIHFTKKEYRLLLDMISIAEWVMNAYTTKDHPQSEPYEELEQKILSYAKEYGFENLIMHDERLNKYFPTGEYEDEGAARNFIEEFEEEVFWEELCSRLARRVLLQEKGIEKLKVMDPVERFTAEDEIAEHYSDEFVANGLKNIILSRK